MIFRVLFLGVFVGAIGFACGWAIASRRRSELEVLQRRLDYLEALQSLREQEADSLDN